MKIKILEKTPGCMPMEFKVGDWIDVCTAEDVTLKGPHALHKHKKKDGSYVERYRDVVFDTALINLGFCMKLPKGYEAILTVRSSTPKKWGIMQLNSIGVIDNLYCGNNDEWKLAAIAYRDTKIPKGTRIAQLRIQLSQKATLWQKLKWLFSSTIVFERVKSLEEESRGGFGEGTNNEKPTQSQTKS